MRSACVWILPQEPLGGGRIGGGAVLQRLHEAADGRERRAQLVRRVGHEVAAHLVQPPPLGDVVEREHRAVRRALVAGERHARERVDAAQVVQLRLQDLALARLQDVLQHLAHLALAHRLDEGVADWIAQAQAGAQRLVRQQDDSLVVHREHALFHRGQDRVHARPLARDLGDPLLELVGRAVQDARQLAQLVGARDRAARVQVAGRELAGRVHHAVEGTGQRGREDHRQQRRDHERQQRRGDDRARQVARLLAHAAQRQRHPRHAQQMALLAHGHRGVHEVVRHRCAAAHRRAVPRPQRVLDLRSLEMVLQREQRRSRHGGVRDHASVRQDDGDPRVQVAGRLVHQRVDGREVRALRQRGLHQPSHQPRLRFQRHGHLLGRALAEPRQRQQQDGDQRGRRRHDGRDADPSTQP
jgi:hypothetical protein